MLRNCYWIFCFWLLIGSSASLAQPQKMIHEWAEAFVALTTPRWGGQRVKPIEFFSRPLDAKLIWESEKFPIAIHSVSSMNLEISDSLFHDLELAFEVFSHEEWGFHFIDGERGGGSSFDFYISDLDALYEVRADAEVHHLYFDQVSNFVVMDSVLLNSMEKSWWITKAFVEALLQRLDPAEAPSWRKTTASWLATRVTGSLPPEWFCESTDVFEKDSESKCGFSSRSWLGGALVNQALPNRASLEGDQRSELQEEDLVRGNFFMDTISARHDGGTGLFWRDLWQFARQRTWEGTPFRGSPDLWEALEAVSKKSEDSFESLMRELGILYWLNQNTRNSELVRNVVGVDYLIPFDQLPFHSGIFDPWLRAYESSYGWVEMNGDAKYLKIWLRGEFGVRWALTVVALNDSGKELRRVQAFPRKIPELYVPLALDQETKFVLIVVTNLSSRIPDEDIPDENVRTFSLIVDKE